MQQLEMTIFRLMRGYISAQYRDDANDSFKRLRRFAIDLVEEGRMAMAALDYKSEIPTVLSVSNDRVRTM